MKRRSRAATVGLIGLTLGLTPSAVAAKGDVRVTKVEAVVAKLDSAGRVAAVSADGFLRVYGTGDFSVDDGGRTLNGTAANGFADLTDTRALTLDDGLVVTPGGRRALPLAVTARYFLDGTEVSAANLAGRSGDAKVELTVTNKTLRAGDVTYSDAAGGRTRHTIAVSAIPLVVDVAAVELPDARFDGVEANGVVSHAGTTTSVHWSAVLAPPLLPGSATFTLSARTNGFALGRITVAATPGLPGNLPGLVKDAVDKGGSSAQSLRAYIRQFGAGFGQLNSGLTQIKSGVDALTDGLNNTAFDRPLYDEDSTLASNQPGAKEGLQLLSDGLVKLESGIGQVRGGLSTGSLASPGVREGLQLLLAGLVGVSGSSAPNLRSGMVQVQAGIAAVIGGLTTLKAGLAQVSAGIGTDADVVYDCDGNPLTPSDQVADPASCGNPNTVAPLPRSMAGALRLVADGLGLVGTGLGASTDVVYDCPPYGSPGDNPASCPDTVKPVPTSLAGALTVVKGGLDQVRTGLGASTDVVYDCPPYGSPGDNPASCPDTVKPVPTSLAGALSLFKAGADRSVAGIGAGSEFDCTADGAPDDPATCNETTGGVPLTLAASIKLVKFLVDTDNTVSHGGASALLGAASAVLGAGTEFDCPPYDGAPNDPTTCPATAKPLSIAATAQALRSGGNDLANGLGTGTEFDCPPYDGAPNDPSTCPATARPLTVRATVSALASGVAAIVAGLGAGTEFDCPPYDGAPNDPSTCPATARPLTARATVAALAAGVGKLQTGVGTGTELDCPPYSGAPDAYGATCNEGTPGALPLSIRSTARLFKAALDAQIIPGIGATTDGPAASLLGGLQALSGGMAQLLAGVDAAGAGAITLDAGIGQIVTGLGDLDADGKARKAVTTRVSRFGNLIETPATVLYGLRAAIDGLGEVLTGFGSRDVSGSTVLSGLKQLSDALGLTVSGTASGRDGAAQLSNVVEKTVGGQDLSAALMQAGQARAGRLTYFVSAPRGATSRVVFSFVLPAIGGE